MRCFRKIQLDRVLSLLPPFAPARFPGLFTERVLRNAGMPERIGRKSRNVQKLFL